MSRAAGMAPTFTYRSPSTAMTYAYACSAPLYAYPPLYMFSLPPFAKEDGRLAHSRRRLYL